MSLFTDLRDRLAADVADLPITVVGKTLADVVAAFADGRLSDDEIDVIADDLAALLKPLVRTRSRARAAAHHADRRTRWIDRDCHDRAQRATGSRRFPIEGDAALTEQIRAEAAAAFDALHATAPDPAKAKAKRKPKSA